MRKKILVISVFAAFLLVFLPMSAVVGYHNVKSNIEEISIASPLFTNRVNNALSKETEKINNNYLGKERIFNIFIRQKTSFRSWVDKAVKIIDAKPEILNKILNKLYEIPEFVNLLKKHGVSKQSLEKEISYVTKNPVNMREKIDKIVEMYEKQEIEIPDIEPPKPLGFSGQPGCLLTFFLVVFPLVMFIGGFISALLAIIIPGTFIVPGCLEWVFEKVFAAVTEGFQGLTPP